jgi:hypothetical protein
VGKVEIAMSTEALDKIIKEVKVLTPSLASHAAISDPANDLLLKRRINLGDRHQDRTW